MMTISFACPHCGKRTEIAEKYAGQTGSCGSCGQTITVPVEISPTNAAAAPAKGRGGLGVTLIIVSIIALVGLFACGGLVIALKMPAISTNRFASSQTRCQNNLKQIGLAFHNYHAVYGTFPPAYIADADGKPMHSWRVLILPFLEQQALYEQYDFSQPWDSPANLAVTSTTIPAYLCPDHAAANPFGTQYYLITGPNTVFDGAKAPSIAGITDPTSNTILCVEATDTSHLWSEPFDLSAATLSFPLIDGGTGSHPTGRNVLMCDGSVNPISDTLSPQDFNEMVTPAGGEITVVYGH